MDLKIPEPCQERWEEMEPRGDGRFCLRCEHTVVDLTRMSQAQVEARLRRARSAYLCVRMPVDARGEPSLRKSPSPARQAAGGLALVAALTAGGCARAEPESAVITEVAEPCSLPDGPPMLPVDPGSEPSADPMVTGPVHVVPPEASADAGPTAEQRSLTQRKHRPQPVPAHHAVMGRMPIGPGF